MSYISIQCYATNPASIKFTIFPAKQPHRVFVVDIPDTQNGTEIAVKHLRDDLLKAFSLSVEDAELLSKIVVTAANEAELEGISRLVQALGLAGVPYPYPMFVNELGWLYTILDETVPTDMAKRIIAQHPRFMDHFTSFEGETTTIYAGFCLRPGAADWMHIHSTRWTKNLKEATRDLKRFTKDQHYRAITKG